MYLKEWLIYFPPYPGRQLLFTDLSGMGFDFSFLPERVEVVDPPFEDKQDRAKHDDKEGEHGGGSVEHGARTSEHRGDRVLSTSLPPTPDS